MNNFFLKKTDKQRDQKQTAGNKKVGKLSQDQKSHLQLNNQLSLLHSLMLLCLLNNKKQPLKFRKRIRTSKLSKKI